MQAGFGFGSEEAAWKSGAKEIARLLQIDYFEEIDFHMKFYELHAK